jgi:hypothetical protein
MTPTLYPGKKYLYWHTRGIKVDEWRGVIDEHKHCGKLVTLTHWSDDEGNVYVELEDGERFVAHPDELHEPAEHHALIAAYTNREDIRLVELPYSEVCMHMKVNGRGFSFPITRGEAGVLDDRESAACSG